MRKLTILALAAMAVLSVTPAFGQGMMHKKPMMQKGMMSHDKMMMGMSSKEKMMAKKMMMKMSKADHMRVMGGMMPRMKMTSMQKMVAMKMAKNAKTGMMKKPMMHKGM